MHTYIQLNYVCGAFKSYHIWKHLIFKLGTRDQRVSTVALSSILYFYELMNPSAIDLEFPEV